MSSETSRKQEEQAKGCIGFMLDEDIFSMELTPEKIGKQYGCFYKNSGFFYHIFLNIP